jgi:hypothetical protein
MDVALELCREDVHCVELFEGTGATMNMHGSTDLAPRGTRRAIFFAGVVVLMPQNIFCLFLDFLCYMCVFSHAANSLFSRKHKSEMLQRLLASTTNGELMMKMFFCLFASIWEPCLHHVAILLRVFLGPLRICVPIWCVMHCYFEML